MNRGLRIARIAVCALICAALLIWVALPQARILIAERVALAQLGKPYIFGADGPESFDCSGLMLYAYGKAGVELAHHALTVANDERYETVDDSALLREGDLVFFDTISGGSKIDHVGLWLGHGRFVHASSSQKEIVVSAFDEKWQARFSWAKRVV